MKKNDLPPVILAILIFFSFSLASVSSLYAQSFEKGLELYQQGNYSEAATVFNSVDSDKARLFSGKSYFGMGEYITAKTYFKQLTEQTSADLYLEAQYNLALTDFQLGHYGQALNRLYPIKKQKNKTQLVNDSIQLYEDILHFLTINQRKDAFQQAEEPQTKYDLVSAAIGDVEYSVAQTLYEQLEKAEIDTTSQAMQELSKIISDSMAYAIERTYGNQSRTPKGITYTIGAALPSYESNAPEYEVSRGLYFGFVLAAEQFNRQNTDQKAFIRYQNTSANPDSALKGMTNLAWNYNADVVLGPLFSEPAQRMTKLAEQYQIPMVAPLANSDSLNFDNPYVYQANPTFTSHGKRMAEYAVKELNMDTLAVLTEKNSLGEHSAYAFRDRAEKLGARVSYFFIEDLESQGFDLTDYTKYFTTDSAKIDSMKYHYLDGIYAPFTGKAASTLAELLLVDLEAMGSELTVLGSQEWGNINIPEEQLEDREVYFSESYYMDKKKQEVEQFIEEFQKRFDTDPNRFAMIGYDTATFVLNTLERIGNPELLKNALKNQPLSKGLIGNIFFNGTHINQEVKIFNISKDGIQPVIKQ